MGNLMSGLIKPASGRLCKFQTGKCVRQGRWVFLAVPLVLAILLAAGVAIADNGLYETWSADSFTLMPRESFQVAVTYDQIQVRNWKLVVDGGDQNCDLHVIRLKDNSLLYQQNDQQHHEVVIPWGQGEAVSIVITNRTVKGAFVVSLLGPPRDQVHASYSYHVNRALDKFGAGQRLAAESECRAALLDNPDDGVAKVLLAGFLRDRRFFGRATTLVDEALAGELPGSMREIAESMRQELITLRAPLPLPVRQGAEAAEDLLIAGQAAEALTRVQKLLEGDLDLDAPSRGRLLMLQGQALDQLNRDFEAIDSFTEALQLSRTKAVEAVIYFHMGRLFFKMDNLPQAQGAFTMALQIGLPSGLDKQARESLGTIESHLSNGR